MHTSKPSKPISNGLLLQKLTLAAQGITTHEFALLMVIASHLGRKKVAWPSYTTLSKETKLKHRSTISRTIKSLIQKGIIKIKDGRRSNTYKVSFKALWQMLSGVDKKKLHKYLKYLKTTSCTDELVVAGMNRNSCTDELVEPTDGQPATSCGDELAIVAPMNRTSCGDELAIVAPMNRTSCGDEPERFKNVSPERSTNVQGEKNQPAAAPALAGGEPVGKSKSGGSDSPPDDELARDEEMMKAINDTLAQLKTEDY